jgi:hypothetical protein
MTFFQMGIDKLKFMIYNSHTRIELSGSLRRFSFFAVKNAVFGQKNGRGIRGKRRTGIRYKVINAEKASRSEAAEKREFSGRV